MRDAVDEWEAVGLMSYGRSHRMDGCTSEVLQMLTSAVSGSLITLRLPSQCEPEALRAHMLHLSVTAMG